MIEKVVARLLQEMLRVLGEERDLASLMFVDLKETYDSVSKAY